MPVRTIYECALCSKEHEVSVEKNNLHDPIPLKEVGVSTIELGYFGYGKYHAQNRHQTAVWCDDCIAQRNVKNLVLKAKVAAKPPTLEDLVREIVRNENGNRE